MALREWPVAMLLLVMKRKQYTFVALDVGVAPKTKAERFFKKKETSVAQSYSLLPHCHKQ